MSMQETKRSTPAQRTERQKTKDVGHVKDRDWWQSAVIYQIYPRSYADMSGDGVGDLRGIIDKLPYITNLGVDAIWLSPFFASPMKDFGYDVSNYKAVDPIFGTLSDFKDLVREANRRHIKIIIDQVYSHTSDLHPWFLESKADKTNAKADWYVWADAQPDGTPPNNWQSVFGGSAWQWHTTREQYYLHNFLAEQPDLNFHHPEVADAILDVAKFWLDLGVSGFRLDTVNLYFHDQKLRSNPPADKEDGEIAGHLGRRVNPYHFQKHLYDKSQIENIGFLRRLRALTDHYGAAMTVGEVSDDKRGLDVIKEYTKDTDRLHTCYSFDFLSDKFSPQFFKGILDRFETIRKSDLSGKFPLRAAQSWACWAFSNHDVTRSATRWFPLALALSNPSDPSGHDADERVTNGAEARERHINDGRETVTSAVTTEWSGKVVERDFIKLVMALLGSLAGPICIYQGEELGLPEAEIKFEDLQDPYGMYFYPKYKGRDGCRTPMPWIAKERHAGFSQASHAWLPVAETHYGLAADVQAADSASSLIFTQTFLKFRKQQPILIQGELKVLVATETVLGLARILDGESIYAYFNFTGRPTQVSLPVNAMNVKEHVLFSHNMAGLTEKDGKRILQLKAYGCAFLGAFSESS